MEDNSCSDDEIKDSPSSPKLGSKKLKLNDGSSQDSAKETPSVSKEEKDENVDSGVSADKSESTSSEDRATAAVEAPVNNEVVTVAPSSSNVHAILLNIRHPRRSRFYRKRKTPDRDSDSDSSRDSDDLSVEEMPEERANNLTDGDSATDSSNGMPSASSSLVNRSSSDSSSDSNESYDSDDLLNIQSGDTDSDEAPWFRNNDDENQGKLPPVLLKTQPVHKYQILREVFNREMGLTFPYGKMIQSDLMFERKFYGSLHAVYRLDKLHNLVKHKGCVNSINFHPEGRLLASGSDDTNVIIWDWAKRTALQTIKTGHKSNVFQSKFLYLNAQSQLNIVTCARDGQVRLLQCPASGGTASRRRLASHKRPAHKLHVSAADPHVVVSAGEDGLVIMSDVRVEHTVKNFHLCSFPLYSMAGHPLNKNQLLLAGQDKFVHVFDTRRATQPLAKYCPGHFHDQPNKGSRRMKSTMHLTCAVYNHNGTEILGSYNDEDVYLFDVNKDVYDKDTSDGKDGYTHRYSGHRNIATFKGVSFFGPKSEYIVSGSDCSYIYIWEKESEAIVQWMEGDMNGVVNCIETHPRFPVMATSGLDKDVKLWIPKRQMDPDYKGMKKVVRENSFSPRSPLFNDFLPSLYSAWRNESRSNADDSIPSYGGNIEFDGNVCTAF
ncbi:DDB1- and CUL4-associated factor 8 [Maniola hyperantus]|uniref:DDB1- and CUL4-associated factor 8 n=1 Tax=Aphantopus hyperantus TaxID=2795564 RepID=UPI001568DDEA|nr:DDB1- and CUL4-associated factor 8 [Maniola hyperantus]XP_034827389.1 DDB1- and CUL4-associated factor 8 [Maniola hyperantus]